MKTHILLIAALCVSACATNRQDQVFDWCVRAFYKSSGCVQTNFNDVEHDAQILLEKEYLKIISSDLNIDYVISFIESGYSGKYQYALKNPFEAGLNVKISPNGEFYLIGVQAQDSLDGTKMFWLIESGISGVNTHIFCIVNGETRYVDTERVLF